MYIPDVMSLYALVDKHLLVNFNPYWIMDKTEYSECSVSGWHREGCDPNASDNQW